MKCVKYVGPYHKRHSSRTVGRYTDEEAAELVASGAWKFASKKEWKAFKAKSGEKENVRASNG